jgi:hypothetical protein
MSASRLLIITILVCFCILAAGCTGRDTKTVNSPSTPERLPLESMVLTSSDVPRNFTLVESRAKNATDVGNLALSLGWQQGYVVRYARSPEGVSGTTEILHTIALYPEKNIPAIAELIERQERSDSNMTFSNISSPSLGNYSHAFSGKENIRIINKSDNLFLLEYDSAKETIQQDFIEIIFSKGDILEIIRLTGTGSDFSTLSHLAQKAYSKIH